MGKRSGAPFAQGAGRSRGGALHTRPPEKMGRFENPITFLIDGAKHPRIKKMLKKHANKKRRSAPIE